MQTKEHQKELLKKIHSEKNVKAAERRPSSVDITPINILVLSGGGLKGYGLPGMCNGLVELNGGDDLLPNFDLVCGTSAGGVGALMCSHFHSVQEAAVEAIATLDILRKTSFRKISWFNLAIRGRRAKKYAQRMFAHGVSIHTGSLTKTKNDMATTTL